MAAGVLAACGSKATPPLPPGTLSGANDAFGHRLRSRDFPAPSETIRTAVAIVGGGIGGLSAGWKLARSGFSDFTLLELEHESGGNSRGGNNAVSPYPLGAHYLPLPPREAPAVKELLRELGALKGEHEYDERLLCQAPQERLYIDGYWQEGLWPTLGATKADRVQYARFQDQVAEFRRQHDKSGRRSFALPLALASQDPNLLALDRMPFRDWLLQAGYTAPGLHWLADYACRDDYGTSAARTSAWAGLHYFSCRDDEGQVLTTPAGNAWLAGGLARASADRIRSNALAFHIEEGKHNVVCDVFLADENRTLRIVARELIWAAPVFLLPYVFSSPRSAWLAALAGTEYAPWIVANLTLASTPQTRAGHPLAWDNVLYDSPALGYVVATHQNLRYAPGPSVITWFRALHEVMDAPTRQRRLFQSHETWAEEVLADLSKPHPEIRELVTRIDVQRYGHAMVRPLPGRLWGGARAAFEYPKGRIRFAHADVSGLSLFEEANYRGVRAAQEVLARLGVSFSNSL
jgi:hypothetical protein